MRQKIQSCFRTINMEEEQYLNLITTTLSHGSLKHGRNGLVHSSIGASMRFSLKNGKLPLITTKKVGWKTCLKELLWFIGGNTDNTLLKKQNVNIWNDNANRDFLNSRGLNNLKENDLGPVYGHQWRHFNATYVNCKTDYKGKGVDQLQNIINFLKHPKEKYSRRILMSSWNPQQIDQMALPPCHVLAQFCVTEDTKLSCILYQRSSDIGLGLPFNIASYGFLTHLLAKHCNMEANELIHFIGDAHVYAEHVDILQQQVNRSPYLFPKLIINCKHDSINDYKINNFEVEDYIYHPTLKMAMRP